MARMPPREMAVQNTDKIWTIVDSKQADYIELSDRVFEMPELNYREVKSAAAHAEQLRREGFRVETGIAGLPTAVMGEAGEDGPVIAIPVSYTHLDVYKRQASTTFFGTTESLTSCASRAG